MKKKYVDLATVLVLFVALVSFFISCNNNTESSSNASTNNEDSLKKMVERGRYLAHTVSSCMDCHSQRDFSQFSGPVKEGTEGMGGFGFDAKFGIPGIVYARNITSDSVNGIGKWTDEEIAKAITRGISRNGDTLFPIMPYMHFNQMSKDDIYSIIAFLRTLSPNSNKVSARNLFIPLAAAYPPLKSASLDNNIKPDISDMVKYGGYMVNAAACMDCHTPMDKGQFVMTKLFAGGYLFDMGPFKVNSANITPDSLTGIGKWTEEMFLGKFKNYRDPETYRSNPGKNNTLMPWAMYAHLDDFDIKAIYRFLRTLPALNNQVAKYP